MEQTVLCGCVPTAMPARPPGVVPPNWAHVAHPPSEDDPSIVIVHVLRFAPAASAAEMERYQAVAGAVAVPHGVRVDGWFAVEGTIVGDGRTWDQIRFNEFPSTAAFVAVASDPARLTRSTSTASLRSPTPTPCWCARRSTASGRRSPPRRDVGADPDGRQRDDVAGSSTDSNVTSAVSTTPAVRPGADCHDQ